MASSLIVDLNCDLGESFGRYKLGDDAAMMDMVTSANIACGFHAGDPGVMARTVIMARDRGVALGAHPGYPDLQGFGRRPMGISAEEVSHLICYQLGALEAFARIAGVRMSHIKPHGALYNLASQDQAMAVAISRAVAAYDRDLILVGLAGSELVRAGQAVGLHVANEGFPDRTYLPDGQLAPRSQPDALITDPEEVARHAVQLVRDGVIIHNDRVTIDTLCIHGDHPHAVSNAHKIRQALQAAGVQIRPLNHHPSD